jgi:hypothetical protein
VEFLGVHDFCGDFLFDNLVKSVALILRVLAELECLFLFHVRFYFFQSLFIGRVGVGPWLGYEGAQLDVRFGVLALVFIHLGSV